MQVTRSVEAFLYMHHNLEDMQPSPGVVLLYLAQVMCTSRPVMA